MRDRIKKLISIGIILLIILVMSIFDISLSSNFGGLLVITVFLTLILGLGEDDAFQNFVPTILPIVSTLFVIWIVYLWVFKIPLPVVGYTVETEMIIALFTVILAVATIVNVSIYRKYADLARLTTLDITINKFFGFEVINTGPFAAKNIKVTIEVIDKKKEKNVWNRMKRNFRDYINVQKKQVGFLGVGGKIQITEFSKFFEKRFNLDDVDDGTYSSESFRTKGKKSLENFIIKLNLSYSSDTLSKAPTPIMKKFRAKIDNSGTTLSEDLSEEHY